MSQAIAFMKNGGEWEPASGVSQEDADSFIGEPILIFRNERWTVVTLHGKRTRYLGICDTAYKHVAIVSKSPSGMRSGDLA